MKIKDFMSKDLVCIDVDRSLRDVRRFMEKNEISRLLVKDKDKIIGIITERDVADRLGDWRERKISDSHIYVSTECSYDLIKINLNQSLSEAASLMLDKGISSLAVCDDGNIIGIITKTDLIKSLRDSKLLVKKYMSKPAISLSLGSSLLQARKLRLERKIKRIIIVLDGKVVGVVTEKDIAKALGMFRKVAEGKHWDERLKKIEVGDVMSRDVICIDENDILGKVVEIMLEKNISGLPVLKDKKLIGMITKTDLVRAAMDLKP